MTYFPRGDIGRWENNYIAKGIGWNTNADKLIGALLSIGWIAPDPFVRLRMKHWRWNYREPKLRRADRIRAAGGEVPRAVRRRVLERSGNRCQQCGSTSDLTIDHIVPVSRGGTSTESNLQALCRSCNSRKRDAVYA